MTEARAIEERVTFTVEDSLCEGILAYPAQGAPTAAVLLLAPHPLLGGNMDNNVVKHLARRAAQDGALTLRFNYRGVGGSGLALPGGLSRFAYFEQLEAEQRYDTFLPDAGIALNLLREAAGPDLPIIVLGYSLGGVLAGMLAASHAPARLACICPPNARVPLHAFRDCHAEKVFVVCGKDVFFDAAAFDEARAGFSGPTRLIRFPDCDHFMRGHEETLYRALTPCLLGESVP